MKKNSKAEIEINVFTIICKYTCIVMSIFLFWSIPIYGADKYNEVNAYENFLNQRHALRCRGVKTFFKADSFYVEDIDNDGVLELFVVDGDVCKNNKYIPYHVHVMLYKYKINRVELMAGVVTNRVKTQYVYISTIEPKFYVNTYNKDWAEMSLDGTYKEYTSKPSLALCKKRKLYKNTYQNQKKYLIKSKENSDYINQSQKDLVGYEYDIQKSAVSFANIFAKNAKSAEATTAPSAKERLKNLGNQLTITGYQEEVPDEVLEAFATAVLDAIENSNIDKYETDQNKLTKQIYNQIKGGMKYDSKKILIGQGSKKTTYTVKYTIAAQSFLGINAQVSSAEVTWTDAKGKPCYTYIVANSTDGNMEKALSSYCAVLAQLNNGIWKEFMTNYITDGWNLAGLNSIKKLDNKTVSKFLDRSENLILVICGDKNAKDALLNDASETLKEKFSEMSKKQFREFIKNNVPNGNEIIEAADKYKKLVNKYNECKNKIDTWKSTKKEDDLTKFQITYEEFQDMLKNLNDSLNEIA